MIQLNLFSGPELRDKGIQKAVDHADREIKNWPGLAYEFLKSYLYENRTFMTKDVRCASKGIVPDPPNNRAWGGIMVHAKMCGLITSIGYDKVKNPKAHCTPATLWRAMI